MICKSEPVKVPIKESDRQTTYIVLDTLFDRTCVRCGRRFGEHYAGTTSLSYCEVEDRNPERSYIPSDYLQDRRRRVGPIVYPLSNDDHLSPNQAFKSSKENF